MCPATRVGAQDRGDQPALAAANVHHPGEAREVVGGHDGRRGGGREDCHPGIEHRPEPRVGGVAREGVLGAEEVAGRALACADAVLKRAPGVPEVIVAEHQNQRAHRARRVGAQAPAERPEREAAVLALREHAEGGQRAQQAPERGRVRAGGGKVVDRPRAVGQQVGQAELRRDVERPRRLIGGGQAQHGRRRRVGGGRGRAGFRRHRDLPGARLPTLPAAARHTSGWSLPWGRPWWERAGLSAPTRHRGHRPAAADGEAAEARLELCPKVCRRAARRPPRGMPPPRSPPRPAGRRLSRPCPALRDQAPALKTDRRARRSRLRCRWPAILADQTGMPSRC